MDIFDTKSEVIRGKLAGMLIGSVASIEINKEMVASTRCLLWAIKDEFGFKIKTRYKDGSLHIKRVS